MNIVKFDVKNSEDWKNGDFGQVKSLNNHLFEQVTVGDLVQYGHNTSYCSPRCNFQCIRTGFSYAFSDLTVEKIHPPFEFSVKVE